MKSIEIEVPDQIYKNIVGLIKEDWFRDEKDLLSETIRRFLNSYQPELMENVIREDVEWGLHGEN